jgi:hypothetical protein
MRHPTEGVLRRLLDEPAGVAEPDRRHVAGCPQCLDGLAAARQDAALVGAALSTGAGAEVDVDAAWQRFPGAAAAGGRDSLAGAPRGRRRGALLRRPAAAAVAVALVLTGASAAAANDWLQIFRTEQITPVSVRTADLVALPALSAYGDVVVQGSPDVHEVPDATVAASETGLDVPRVADLPRGVSGAPSYQVGRKISATFTFSATRAARAAAATGATLPPVPPGLDGHAVRLTAGPGVAEMWGSSAGVPALVVGRAVAPTAFSSGVPFATVRDYLLSLPGLPTAVAEQLRAFDADGSTLPLPIPADRVSASSAQVNGLPATLLRTHDRTLAAVVWVDHGLLTVVAGSLDTGEVLAVAKELR